MSLCRFGLLGPMFGSYIFLLKAAQAPLGLMTMLNCGHMDVLVRIAIIAQVVFSQ